MAEKKTTTTVELDGNHLVSALQKAGLDPTKLDLKETLGPRVDIQELQSRLHSVGKAAASHWHVNVTVTVSRD